MAPSGIFSVAMADLSEICKKNIKLIGYSKLALMI